MLAGCARMGQPDGGWYDDNPPRIVGSTPADRGTKVKAKKIEIEFDEFIKLEDATSKVVVSPPQMETPEIGTSGKKIVVELQDTLMDNTTYTIDFSDAISDNNEGNPMGNYTYTFSTGDRIDTLEVSGTVVNAENLEPIKGILVGLYADTSDTAFVKHPLLRVSRTDSRGHFVIKGIAPGSYRAYALQDADGDYRYSQKSEMLAFDHNIFEPYSKPDVRQDTIWRDSLRIDSIMRVPYIHYYPDELVLRAFTAIQTDRYLLKTERAEPDRLGIYFSYGDGTLPQLRGLNFDSDSAFVVDANEKCDTIVYWLRDTTLINRDSLEVELQYMATDTAGVLVNNIDTLEMIPKMSYEKRMKAKQKEFEKWQKQQEKAKKKGEAYDSIMRPKPLALEFKIEGSMSPEQNVKVVSPAPLARCDTAAIHLYSKIDTLWYRSRIEMQPIKGNIRAFQLMAEWRPGVEYSLEVDSAAFEDIYGNVSDPIKKGIKVVSEDECSSLIVNVTGVDNPSAVIVQLLNSSDAVVKESKVEDGSAAFFYLKAGKYYLRAFVDSNGNGKWDTGDFDADLQPEEVYYYPKEVECKEKWDITTSWNLTATPLAKQKPGVITKQKPEQEKKLKNRNYDRAKQLGIEYVKDKIYK